jgi:lysophospholipase L1-like esterase
MARTVIASRAAAALLLTAAVLVPLPARADAPLRVGVVGDSIAGSCADPDGGMCAALDSLLTARGIAATFHLATVPQASCGGIIAAEAAMLAADHPDLVIIMCGTNNPTATPPDRDALGWQWRTLVEAAHGAGAKVLPALIQYSDPGINAAAGRSWLVEGEARANDTLYGQWHYYEPSGWFAGKLDLQQVPGNRDYLKGGTDGIHPNRLGQQVYAALIYRALRVYYGWPDAVPQPCGMWGARPDPSYQQYVAYIPCTGKS